MKVQSPGMAAALRSDLDNLGAVVKAMALTSRALDGRAYFPEVSEELTGFSPHWHRPLGCPPTAALWYP